MGKSAPSLRLLLIPIVVAVLWLLPAVVGNLLMGWQRVPIPSSVTAFVFPDTLPSRMRYLVDGPGFAVLAGLAALAVAAFAAALLPASGRDRGTPRPTAFLAAWSCMVLASVAGSAVLSTGLVIAEWPFPRKAWIFESFTPPLLTGAYWGVFWGWLPALLAVSLPAGQPRRAAEPRGSAVPRRPWLVSVGTFGASAVALCVLLPALAADPATRAAPEPVPTPEPVIYGADELGPSQAAPDPQWCTGDEVLAGVDGWDAATGHRGARVTVQNTGTRTCTVQGHPDLAFETAEGQVMNITAVHGGSFMTDDTSDGPVILGPGQSASAGIGWNGTAGAGMDRVGTLLVAPFSGTVRQELEADIDLAEPGFLTVTGWIPAEPLTQG